MEYASLIAEFGANYGLDDLTPDENGAVGFEADGRPVAIQKLAETQTVIVTIDLCEAPESGAAAVDQLLLKANLALFVLDGMALVLHPESNRYRLVMRLDMATMDFIDFDDKLSKLLDRAEQWSAFLDKFLPLVAEAETKGEKSETTPTEMPSEFEMLRI